MYTKQHPKAMRKFLQHANIGEPDRCWVWGGEILGSGYGRVSWYTGGKKHNVSAHRMSFMVYTGDIPKGLCVLHHCDNRPCVNPRHLYAGTHKDNMADAMKRGRYTHPRGEAHSGAKLSERDVLTIRKRRSAGDSGVSLAAFYSVSEQTISDIYHRETWDSVPPPEEDT